MQFSATVNRFIVKTYLNSAFTNDLKRKENFSKNVNSCRLSLFKCAYGPQSEKTCLRCLRATIGADTSAHSDQCYFFFCYLKSILSTLAMSEMPILYVDFVAEYAGMRMTR